MAGNDNKIMDELVEHLVLEKIGAIPDSGHADKLKIDKKVSKKKKSSFSWFYLIITLVIVFELVYIGSFLVK